MDPCTAYALVRGRDVPVLDIRKDLLPYLPRSHRIFARRLHS